MTGIQKNALKESICPQEGFLFTRQALPCQSPDQKTAVVSDKQRSKGVSVRPAFYAILWLRIMLESTLTTTEVPKPWNSQ